MSVRGRTRTWELLTNIPAEVAIPLCRGRCILAMRRTDEDGVVFAHRSPCGSAFTSFSREQLADDNYDMWGPLSSMIVLDHSGVDA